MEAMEKEVLDAFTTKLKPPKTKCLSYEGCARTSCATASSARSPTMAGPTGWPDDGGKSDREFLGTLK
jgi:hypothetical protein